jgi:hypothetical protein
MAWSDAAVVRVRDRVALLHRRIRYGLFPANRVVTNLAGVAAVRVTLTAES